MSGNDKKADDKKQKGKKDAPKKEAPKKVEEKPAAEEPPVEKKSKDPFLQYPASETFIMDEWKKVYSNEDTVTVRLSFISSDIISPLLLPHHL